MVQKDNGIQKRSFECDAKGDISKPEKNKDTVGTATLSYQALQIHKILKDNYATTISMFTVIHHTTFHCIPHMCSHLPQAKMHMLHSVYSCRQRQQSHTSEVTRDPNLIDYRCFIERKNQREKRYSNIIVPQQDTFLLPVSIQNLRDKLKVIFLYVISYCKLFFTATNWWETGSAYYTDKCEIFTSSWFLSPIVVIWKWIISYSLFSNCRLLATKKKIEKEGRT